MRVLLITHPESDYGGAFLYNGLCRLLGHKNVFDFPEKLSYHGEVHRYSTPAIQDGCTGPLAWMPDGYPRIGVDGYVPTASDVRVLLAEGVFSLVIVESFRTLAIAALRDVVQCVHHYGVPLVMHDGEDYRGVDAKLLEEFRPAALLKREVPRSESTVLRTAFTSSCRALRIAFPFSCPFDAINVVEPEKKLYDVVAMFGRTHSDREKLVKALRADKDLRSFAALSGDDSTEQQLLEWHQYLAVAAASHMGASIQGYGVDTCRYWEVPAVTALLCDAVDLCIPHPFEHSKTCFETTSVTDAVELCRKYAGTELCSQVYADGLAHLRAHHTNEARVSWMLDVLRTEGILHD